MEQRIKIEEAESKAVETLFYQFNSYCGILGYMAKYGSLDTNLFDKKWEEAVNINIELEKLKQQLDKKYHPNDTNQCTGYEFNFNTNELIYYYERTNQSS